jgi:hypothetical protein
MSVQPARNDQQLEHYTYLALTEPMQLCHTGGIFDCAFRHAPLLDVEHGLV